MPNDYQGRHNPASRRADQARLAAIARAMAIGAALALLVLFAFTPAYAATTPSTCPAGWSALTPFEWLLGAIILLVVDMAFAGWLKPRLRDVNHLLGHNTTNIDLSALASTRVDTSCPGLLAANADLAKRRHLRAISTPRAPTIKAPNP